MTTKKEVEKLSKEVAELGRSMVISVAGLFLCLAVAGFFWYKGGELRLLAGLISAAIPVFAVVVRKDRKLWHRKSSELASAAAIVAREAKVAAKAAEPIELSDDR